MDCVWREWSDYTECKGLCGTGTRNRTRTIQVQSDHGGSDCVGNSTEIDESCTILDKPCPGSYQIFDVYHNMNNNYKSNFDLNVKSHYRAL